MDTISRLSALHCWVIPYGKVLLGHLLYRPCLFSECPSWALNRILLTITRGRLYYLVVSAGILISIAGTMTSEVFRSITPTERPQLINRKCSCFTHWSILSKLTRIHMPNFVLIWCDSFLVCVGVVACNHLIFSLKGVYDKPGGQVSGLISTQLNTRPARSIRLSTRRHRSTSTA